MDEFEKPEFWEELVDIIDTVEAFEGTSRGLFIDGEVTPVRLMVLELLARDVSKAHPSIGAQVMRHFHKVLSSSESIYTWLCFTHSK